MFLAPHIEWDRKCIAIFEGFCDMEVKVAVGATPHKGWPDAISKFSEPNLFNDLSFEKRAVSRTGIGGE